jgi:aminocarboxymuconate-semialdehyde decarboxylase
MYAHSIGRSETIGSDYCYNMGYERPLQFLEQLDLTSAQRSMILGGTAAKLLRV